MALEIRVQEWLHTTEQGAGTVWLRRILLGSAVVLIAALWLVMRFNGFSLPEAMDQAQIARQLATGQGYTTLYARPLALHLTLARKGSVPSPMKDTSQAPLGPVISAVAMKVTGAGLSINPESMDNSSERVIALTGFAFFAASLALIFLLLRRLFDPRLALLATGLVIVSDLFWRFSFSGLPQMPMLFFFSGALLSLAAAMDAQDAGRPRRAAVLLLASAALLGVMTLGDGRGVWIFGGFWIFAVLVMRPRWLSAAATPAAFALPLLPWLLHNWLALRQPLGLPFFELYRPAGTDRLAWLADFEPLLRFHEGDFLRNTWTQALDLLSGLPASLGGSIAAAAFVLAVFSQIFARWQAAQFRWAVLLMLAGAMAGMCVFPADHGVASGQLLVLFVPVMGAYGLAFLLAQLDRLNLRQEFFRTACLIALFIVTALPLLIGLKAGSKRFNWPPYLPPLIARFAEWFEPGEAIASDIPWATAWYAGRISLLLPESIEQFELIHGEKLLGAPLVGLYLTPFSAERRTYADVINGRYREWSRFVLREVGPQELQRWMLRTAVALPIDGGSMLYADRPRWQ